MLLSLVLFLLVSYIRFGSNDCNLKAVLCILHHVYVLWSLLCDIRAETNANKNFECICERRTPYLTTKPETNMSRLLHTVWGRAWSSSFCFCVNQTLPDSCNEFYKRLIYGRGLENFVHISKNQRMAAMSTATSNGNTINHADTPGKKFKIRARSAEISHEVHNFSSDRLIWVDLEMTGLDFVRDRILEIAILITEPDLQIVAEGPNIIIHESDEVLENMGEWCKQQHGKSGLAEAVRQSKVSLVQAEQMALEFVRQHTPTGRCPLAGNTIGMDRSFIERHMPEFARHLHHRVVDVSTVKELCRRWFPEDFKVAPVKKENHRAMDDILESIAELKFYRSSIFKKPFVLF